MMCCEGCGIRSDQVEGVLRELPVTGPDGESQAPVHTPKRCELAQAARRIFELRFPGWYVAVGPTMTGEGEAFTVWVYRRQRLPGHWVAVSRILPSCLLKDTTAEGGLLIFLELEARALEHVLAAKGHKVTT